MRASAQKFLIFLIAGTAYLIGEYFRGYWWPNITWPFHCTKITFGTLTYCDRVYIGMYGWPLIALGQALAIVGVVLLLANREGLRKWWRFSLWFVPIAAFVILIIAPNFYIFPNRKIPIETVVWLMGYIYILATLIIVPLGWWRARKQPA